MVSAVNPLAVELLRRCEKLTPRLCMLLGRMMVGGLFGHRELDIDPRDIDLRLAAEDLGVGDPFFDTVLERPELRRFEFLRVWILNELP